MSREQAYQSLRNYNRRRQRNRPIDDDEGLPPEGGGGGDGEDLPEAPEGFAYLVNAGGEYLNNADGAYILAKVEE